MKQRRGRQMAEKPFAISSPHTYCSLGIWEKVLYTQFSCSLTPGVNKTKLPFSFFPFFQIEAARTECNNALSFSPWIKRGTVIAISTRGWALSLLSPSPAVVVTRKFRLVYYRAVFILSHRGGPPLLILKAIYRAGALMINWGWDALTPWKMSKLKHRRKVSKKL